MYYYIHSPEGSVDIYYSHISICPMITCYTVYMTITLNIYYIYFIFLPYIFIVPIMGLTQYLVHPLLGSPAVSVHVSRVAVAFVPHLLANQFLSSIKL